MVYASFSRLPPARNEQILVTATSKIIADARVELQPRQVWIIQNVSPTKGTDIIYVRLGSEGVADNTLFPLDVGDSIVDSNDSGYTCHQDTISAICATANGKINIIER
jgi:hypothetical protein